MRFCVKCGINITHLGWDESDKCGYCRRPWWERLKLRVFWAFHGRHNV